MSSADLITELRATRPVAGDALRERVREIAASTPPPRRAFATRFAPRRVALVALPAAAAVALTTAGALGLARSDGSAREAGTAPPATTAADALRSTKESAPGPTFGAAGSAATATPGTALPPSATRPQRYAAELTIEVADADALSAAAQRALRITDSLGGYVVTSSLDAQGEDGSSSLVVRVPTARVQDAIVRMSELGKIVGQRVSIEDLGGQQDVLARQETALVGEIARLERQLSRSGLVPEERAALRSRLAQARAELVQVRAAQAQSREEARYATVSLLLRTEEDPGVAAPASRFDRTLDEIGRILAWEAAALLYALVVAGPFVLVGAGVWWLSRQRRRRDDERLLAAS
ncbi:MAG TPA: DUF4349 domain-containing protein [Gaiellaceae bacterium]|nr:DUF4349 domain-containing protein [Gaiellaceae bacterium]